MFFHENKAYNLIERNAFVSIPQEISLDKREPVVQWKSTKIPFTLWQQVLAFMAWTQLTFKSEAMIWLYFHKKDFTWSATPPPQKVGTGMTVKTLEISSPEYNRLKAIQEQHFAFDKDNVLYGTVHHHCTASAFQSSTDAEDEKKIPGIHFTIGNLDKECGSIHSRFSDNQLFYKVNNKEIIDVESFVEHHQLGALLPSSHISQLCDSLLTYFPKTGFPEWWKEMCYEAPSVLYPAYPAWTRSKNYVQQETYPLYPYSGKVYPSSGAIHFGTGLYTTPTDSDVDDGSYEYGLVVEKEQAEEHLILCASIMRDDQREHVIYDSFFDMNLELVRNFWQRSEKLFKEFHKDKTFVKYLESRNIIYTKKNTDVVKSRLETNFIAQCQIYTEAILLKLRTDEEYAQSFADQFVPKGLIQEEIEIIQYMRTVASLSDASAKTDCALKVMSLACNLLATWDFPLDEGKEPENRRFYEALIFGWTIWLYLIYPNPKKAIENTLLEW